MAPRLPIYEQRTTPTGPLLPADMRMVNTVVAPDTSIGQGLQQMGQAVGQLDKALSLEKTNEANAWLSSARADLELKIYQMTEDSKRSTVPGAKGFTDSLLKRIDDLRKESMKNAPEYARRQLDSDFNNWRETYGKTGVAFEIGERDRWTGEQFEKATDSNAKLIDLVPYEQKTAEAERFIVTRMAEIDRSALMPEQKAAAKEKLLAKMREAANISMIKADPSRYLGDVRVGSGYIDKLKQVEGTGKNPKSTASGQYQFLDGTWVETVRKHAPQYAKMSDAEILAMKKEDGAFKDTMFMAFTNDNRNGLRSALGREPTDGELYLAHQQGLGGAVSLINSPNMPAVDIVGSAAVLNNGGDENMTAAEFAQKWTSKFGDISLSPAAYIRAGNPVFDMGTYEEQQKWITTAQEQELAVLKQRNDLAEQQRKEAKRVATDAAMPFMYESGGDWTTIPLEIREQAKQAGVWEDVIKYTGADDPQLVSQLYGMGPEELATFDMTTPEVQSRLSQTTREKFLGKQQEINNNPANGAKWRSMSDMVGQAWRSTGKETTDPGFANFSNAVENALVSYEQTTGKKPDRKAAQTIMSTLMLDTDGWGTKRAYTAQQAGEQFEVEGLAPEQLTPVVNAMQNFGILVDNNNVAQFVNAPENYIRVPGVPPEQVKPIVDSLMRNNAAVTPENIFIMFSRANNG
jgi:hypothetical protein